MLKEKQGIKGSIKRFLQIVLRKIPIKIWSGFFPKEIICLYYHVVSDTVLSHALFYPYKNSEKFENDIKYLKSKFQFINYDSIQSSRIERNPLNRKNGVLITFDDGFVQCATEANPILKRHNVPAIFFVTTDWLENKNLFYESKLSLCINAVMQKSEIELKRIFQGIEIDNLVNRKLKESDIGIIEFRRRNVVLEGPVSSMHRQIIDKICALMEEDSVDIHKVCQTLGVDFQEFLDTEKPFLTTNHLQELIKDGHTIGAHSRTHRNLNNLSNMEVEEEIVTSCQRIYNITNHKVPFAFPFNGRKINRQLLKRIQQEHSFVGLFFDTNGFHRDASYVINRIWCDLPGESPGNYSNLRQVLANEWVVSVQSSLRNRS